MASSALWILGASLLLTVLGFAEYHAHAQGRRMRQILSEPGYSAAINFGLSLFSLGMMGSARSSWERVLWAVLGVAFAIQFGRAWRSRRKPPT